MTAVIGGKPDEVLAAIEAQGLTAGQQQRQRPDRRGRDDGAARRPGGEPAAPGPPDPAQRRRGVPHRAHGPRGRPAGEAGRARSAPHDPSTRLLSNADGQVVADGADVLRRLVGQVASPVRWDLCLQAMADLGVTGLLELPPPAP